MLQEQSDRLGAETRSAMHILWGALVLLAAAVVVGGSITGILSLNGSSQQVSLNPLQCVCLGLKSRLVEG